MVKLLLALFFFLPAPPVQVDVTPRIAFAPNTVTIMVRAESKETNRGLTLVINSENYYRSSFDTDYVYDPQLGGTPNISKYQYELRAPGHYVIMAILHRALPDKDQRGEVELCLSGPDVEC